MHMYANDATLKIGISHVRPVLPDLLDFVARTGFAAEEVTTLLADWEDAPERIERTSPNSCCTELRSAPDLLGSPGHRRRARRWPGCRHSRSGGGIGDVSANCSEHFVPLRLS
ncbi:hypothetical protein [Nocardia xishanensis]|uniref:hypothetical protein n=1 Tax=Nocardia xishanensis TaxID=238964 RepID=UPI001FE0CCDF|nr:hypothetical protein [Nocardia xishanensis]